MSSGYKNSLTEKGSPEETYTPESIALIQVSGTGVHNNKALQVEAVLFYCIFSLTKCQYYYLSKDV